MRPAQNQQCDRHTKARRDRPSNGSRRAHRQSPGRTPYDSAFPFRGCFVWKIMLPPRACGTTTRNHYIPSRGPLAHFVCGVGHPGGSATVEWVGHAHEGHGAALGLMAAAPQPSRQSSSTDALFSTVPHLLRHARGRHDRPALPTMQLLRQCGVGAPGLSGHLAQDLSQPTILLPLRHVPL